LKRVNLNRRENKNGHENLKGSLVGMTYIKGMKDKLMPACLKRLWALKKRKNILVQKKGNEHIIQSW